MSEVKTKEGHNLYFVKKIKATIYNKKNEKEGEKNVKVGFVLDPEHKGACPEKSEFWKKGEKEYLYKTKYGNIIGISKRRIKKYLKYAKEMIRKVYEL